MILEIAPFSKTVQNTTNNEEHNINNERDWVRGVSYNWNQAHCVIVRNCKHRRSAFFFGGQEAARGYCRVVHIFFSKERLDGQSSAWLAQSVERWTLNPTVVGSSPTLGALFYHLLTALENILNA